jgi:hypothetical protein
MTRDVPTSAGAGVVVAAVPLAFVSPFLADVEGEGLRVLGDVRGNVVLTDAGVGEQVRITVVLDGGHRSHAGLLEADERALGFLVITPGFWGRVSEWSWLGGIEHTYACQTQRRRLG